MFPSVWRVQPTILCLKQARCPLWFSLASPSPPHQLGYWPLAHLPSSVGSMMSLSGIIIGSDEFSTSDLRFTAITFVISVITVKVSIGVPDTCSRCSGDDYCAFPSQRVINTEDFPEDDPVSSCVNPSLTRQLQIGIWTFCFPFSAHE